MTDQSKPSHSQSCEHEFLEDEVCMSCGKPAVEPSVEKPYEFEEELCSLINRFSKENGSNTPDWILADYLTRCLDNFNLTSRAREKWYGKELKI